VLVGGGWYGSVVVGSGCSGQARPSMRPVWPYLTPALTALYLGNQNPPKNHIRPFNGPPPLLCARVDLNEMLGCVCVRCLHCYLLTKPDAIYNCVWGRWSPAWGVAQSCELVVTVCGIATARGVVRKTPSGPRTWANFSLSPGAKATAVVTAEARSVPVRAVRAFV
jgi:hypothetical protein